MQSGLFDHLPAREARAASLERLKVPRKVKPTTTTAKADEPQRLEEALRALHLPDETLRLGDLSVRFPAWESAGLLEGDGLSAKGQALYDGLRTLKAALGPTYYNLLPWLEESYVLLALRLGPLRSSEKLERLVALGLARRQGDTCQLSLKGQGVLNTLEVLARLLEACL